MELKNSVNYDPSNIHIIDIITSSVPDCVLINDDSIYSQPIDYNSGKNDATDTRNRMILDLGMTEDQDEIDVEIARNILAAVTDPNFWTEENISWLCEDIAWPGSDYYDDNPDIPWPPETKGWVRSLHSADQLIKSIAAIFRIYSSDDGTIRTNTAKIIASDYPDPNPSNNEKTITIPVGR